MSLTNNKRWRAFCRDMKAAGWQRHGNGEHTFWVMPGGDVSKKSHKFYPFNYDGDSGCEQWLMFGEGEVPAPF